MVRNGFLMPAVVFALLKFCSVKNRQLIHNLKSTKGRRKELRGNLTPVEALLWKCLQRSQLAGKKFRRQHAIGPFIVDFYCPECRLGVELDGAAHKTIPGNERDGARDLFLARFKVRILRFENRLVRENLEGVLEAIKHAMLEGPTLRS
jgi:very-short-patch-repair endonuclease